MVVEAVLSWSGGLLPAFVLTCAIEIPGYLLGWATLGWLGRQVVLRVPAAVLLVIVVNLATHPLLWLTAAALPWLIIPLELLAVAIEGLIVALVVRHRSARFGAPAPWAGPVWAWPVALGVNALSVLAGSALLSLIMDRL
ncbi:hypothetical protein [Microlunatus sp. GCM10028923]|uniref:hypothetical protein n=1 Tax=Microlunatus sp. GCM10028923 TaxID=3273400 RepID=UPI00360BF3D8